MATRPTVVTTAMLATFVACSFSGAPGEVASDPDASTSADAAADAAAPGTLLRKPIVIPASVTDEALANFPTYIHADADVELMAAAQPDGSDIFFVDANNAPLDYEIESWDASTGTLRAWVRVPSIDPTAGATLYLRYGDIGSAQPPNPSGVWQNAFVAVYHLGENPDGPIVDSTGVRNGTAHASMDATDLVAAKLGNGLQLDGGDDVIDFDNPFSGGSPHTISGWVSQDVAADNEAFVVLGTGGATNGSRFLHTRFFNGAMLTGFYGDDFQTDDDIQGSGFVLVHWTYDGTVTSNVFVNGALGDGPHTHNAAANTQGSEGRIGNAPSGGMGFGTNMGLNGIVDEIRIADVVRSDAWISAEYANQNTPALFAPVGAEEMF